MLCTQVCLNELPKHGAGRETSSQNQVSADIVCGLLRSDLLPEAYVPDKETREAKNVLS